MGFCPVKTTFQIDVGFTEIKIASFENVIKIWLQTNSFLMYFLMLSFVLHS